MSKNLKIHFFPFNVYERNAYLTKKKCCTFGTKFYTKISIYKLMICKVLKSKCKKKYHAPVSAIFVSCELCVLSVLYSLCLSHWSLVSGH